MTPATQLDIQEIKNLILALDQKLISEIIELKVELKNTNAKVEINNAKIDALDKRITDGLNNLDKRISNQEFIYRAVVIGVIGLLLTPLATNAIRYFWENPLFPIH